MLKKTLIAVFICVHSTNAFCNDEIINQRLEDIEDQLEYEIGRDPKQDMLEVLQETGFMTIAKRVEDKLEISNMSLAEGNALMRSMIDRIDKKDRKDEKQDELIRDNDSRISNNRSKIWAIGVLISLILSVLAWIIKETKSVKNKKNNEANKIILYKK